MAETLIVVSKLKKLVKEMGMRTSKDTVEKLSQIIETKIKATAEKVRADGRKTIQAADVE